MLAPGLARAQPTVPVPFTVISKVAEANPRVVALSLDFGQDLPLNWNLQQAFRVKAKLLPVKSHVGDLIANNAVACHERGRSPRARHAAALARVERLFRFTTQFCANSDRR